jgi:saccharopine dehydrogenase (NAD+, L-lysine forming)
MNGKSTFGIIGGYGATGRVVVSELLSRSDADVLIGGRDLAKASVLASQFGARASAACVDAVEARSLDDFCGRCSVVVNCAGPVVALQDRPAQAAFRRRCHYVDLAGMGIVAERLLPSSRQIADSGLSFVVSAGWMPGITELLPAYAHQEARAKMAAVESLNIYFGDSGEWSDSALRDGFWHLRKSGLRRPGYFHNGQWQRVKNSETLTTVDLGDPLGSRRFGLYFMPETMELGRRLDDCDVRSYSYLSGWRSVIDATIMATLPLPESMGVRLLRGVFRRNSALAGGFAAAHVIGRFEGRRVKLATRISFESGRDYWVNAVALATTANFVSQREGIKSGVHYLFDAVDPAAFMAELRNAGITQTETLVPHP